MVYTYKGITLTQGDNMSTSAEAVLELLRECENISEALYQLNKKHPLMKLSGRELSHENHLERNLIVVREYISTLKNTQRIPTIEQLFIAFGKYHIDLVTALTIERAKQPAQSSH